MSPTLSPVRVQLHAWNLWKWSRKQEATLQKDMREKGGMGGNSLFKSVLSEILWNLIGLRRRTEDVWVPYQRRLPNLWQFVDSQENGSHWTAALTDTRHSFLMASYFLTRTTDQYLWPNLEPFKDHIWWNFCTSGQINLHPTCKRVIQSDLCCLPPCLLSV